MLMSTAVIAQLPPASEVLPAGFKVIAERNLGGSMIIKGTKANENVPKPHGDPGIEIEIMWRNTPSADRFLDMMANQPEDPARQIPGSATREEPCGVQRYRDGVLTCRKVITPWIGGGSGPSLVTWRIGWAGKAQEGLVSVGINNFCGSKETAMAWIDAIIPKITKTT